jgi:hypothetical protein
MDKAPHNMAVRFFIGEVTISEVKTPRNKTYFARHKWDTGIKSKK